MESLRCLVMSQGISETSAHIFRPDVTLGDVSRPRLKALGGAGWAVPRRQNFEKIENFHFFQKYPESVGMKIFGYLIQL